MKNTPNMYIRNPREIEFDNENKGRGLRVLMLSGAPVRVVGKNRYVVSDIHCNLLKEEGIGYKIIK